MRTLIVIMLMTLMSLASCATKRKTKEVEQINQNLEKSVVNDSSVNLQLQKSTYDYLQNYSKNEMLLQKLGLTYTGKTNDDKAKVSLKQTADGLELDIQGAVAMALDQAKQKDENLSQSEMIKLMDSIYSAKLQQDLVQRDQRLIDYFKSNKVNDTTGIQFGAYLTGFGVLCLIILLFWISRKFIDKK